MSHYITMGFHTLTLYRLHYLCKDEDLLTYSFLLMELQLVCTHNTYKTIKQGSAACMKVWFVLVRNIISTR